MISEQSAGALLASEIDHDNYLLRWNMWENLVALLTGYTMVGHRSRELHINSEGCRLIVHTAWFGNTHLGPFDALSINNASQFVFYYFLHPAFPNLF